MKLKTFIIIIAINMILGCKTRLPTPNNISRLIIKELTIDTNLIRFNGIYNTKDTSMIRNGMRRNQIYSTDRPVIFTKNNRVFRSGGGAVDGIDFTWSFFKNTELVAKYLGYFTIVSDSIYAYLPIELYVWGMRKKLFNANFKGYIKNKDTILNWQMVPPYPNTKAKWNQYSHYDSVPRMLYFIKNEEALIIDSIASQ